MKWLRLPQFLAIALWVAQGFAGELISVRTDSLIKVGIRLSIQQRYEDAIAIFEDLERTMPENPTGYFFHAAVLQSQMMDYEVYRQEPEFHALIRKTVELAEALIRQPDVDPWAYFFLGGGYAYLAFYRGKQNRLLEAFQHGSRSVKALQAALRADSTMYDVYFGLGTYKYYRSKLSRHFTWLPFVDDDRLVGIEMIEKAIAKSRYSKYSAINGLFWIALESDDYQKADSLLTPALESFPDSRVFLWCAAKLAVKRERWQEAVRFFTRILESLTRDGVLFPYNELVCRKNLCLSYVQLQQFERAQQECQKIAKIMIDDDSRRRHPDALEEAQHVCARAESGDAADISSQ